MIGWRAGMVTVVVLAAALVSGAAAAAPDASVEDLLWDLQIVPLDPEPAPSLALPALTGERVSLADRRGRVVMLYFWVST
jgi:hypothetical protein